MDRIINLFPHESKTKEHLCTSHNFILSARVSIYAVVAGLIVNQSRLSCHLDKMPFHFGRVLFIRTHYCKNRDSLNSVGICG